MNISSLGQGENGEIYVVGIGGSIHRIANPSPPPRHTLGAYAANDALFYLRNSNSAGFADLTLSYGPTGAVPLIGDWNGDGTDTVGVYDASNQTFYLRNSNPPGFADLTIRFGPMGAIPLAG